MKEITAILERIKRDEVLLKAIDDMIVKAPAIGVCPMTFRALKAEVTRIIQERDDAEKKLDRIKNVFEDTRLRERS